MLAKDIMTKNVISVKKEDLVENVIKILMDQNISGVPVVNDKDHVIGIVTEGDLIYRSKKLKIPTFFSILDGYVFLESTKTIEQQLKKDGRLPSRGCDDEGCHHCRRRRDRGGCCDRNDKRKH